MELCSSYNGETPAYARAIERDGFSCRAGSFYVELDGHQHERKDSRALYDLLAYTPPPPALTKAGKVAKRQPPPWKDKPAHFYRAQLIHYGLKQVKTGESAKKKLLAAYGDKAMLDVPPRILALEEAMKREYEDANRAALEQHEHNVARERAEHVKKEEKAKNNRESAISAFLESETPAIVPSQSPDSGDDDVQFIDRRAPSPKQMSRAQLRKAVSSMSGHRLKTVINKLISEIPALEKALIKETGGIIAKKPSNTRKKQTSLNPDFTGNFQVIAPFLTEQYNVRNIPWLKLCSSSTGSHLWGSFDFDILRGVLRISRPSKQSDGSVMSSYTWRGRESSSGESTFGEDNAGTIVFLGGGKIRARMNSELGTFEFAGRKAEESLERGRYNAAGWKREYRGYTQAAYQRENQVEWGNWGEERYDREGPAESDTTGAEDSEEDRNGGPLLI